LETGKLGARSGEEVVFPAYNVVAMVVTAGKIVYNGIICSAGLVKVSVVVPWLGFFDWVEI
jgi:hypothetical protein